MSVSSTQSGAIAPEPADARADQRNQVKRLRLLAIVAGLVGIVACALTPLLPVKAVQASFTWPQGQTLTTSSSVTAPLIAQTARSLHITIPCAVLAGLPSETSTVLTTVPGGGNRGLTVKAGDTVTVLSRNSLLASAPRAGLAGCSVLRIHSGSAGPSAQFVGLGPAVQAAPEAQPQIDGIFSSLPPAAIEQAGHQGLTARIDIDNRYQSSPTLIKRLVSIVGLLAIIAALGALALLDRRSATVRAAHEEAVTDGELHHRTGFLASLRPRLSDLAVTAALLVWALLGAGGPDDGYILSMGRVAGEAGYLPNYYRFFGIAEAPFSWYYEFLAHWSSVSTSMLWMHLPSLACGLLSWYILSRVLLPRLGTAVSHGWPVWAAASVFTAFWMPFGSGLRSESVIVLGSLLTWWAIESAITSKRLLPVGLAVVAAGFTFAAAPHGVIGIAILLVGARAVLAIGVARSREIGTAAILAPLGAAALAVLLVVFADQTLATVAEAMKETGADVSVIFVPPAFAKAAMVGLFPAESHERKALEGLDPFALRAAALHAPLFRRTQPALPRAVASLVEEAAAGLRDREAPFDYGGFFLRTVLLLIPMLALWYWAREWVVAPPAWLAGKALQFQFPSWVLGIEREGLHHVLLTNLRVVTPNRQIGELTPEIRALSYCYGSALLPALLLGSQAGKLWWKLPAGLALLIPFQAWSIAFAWLLQVAVQAGPQVASEAGFSAMGMNLVAAGYQFGYLIFPALAPVLVWLALDRRLMATVLLEGSLSGKH